MRKHKDITLRLRRKRYRRNIARRARQYLQRHCTPLITERQRGNYGKSITTQDMPGGERGSSVDDNTSFVPPPPQFPPQTQDETPPNISFRLIALCLAAMVICTNFANYGPLIPLLRVRLQVDNAHIGLFSTLLFLGIALANIPGGMLADRFSSRKTMLGSLLLMSCGSLLLPLLPDYTWIAFCRAIIGLGAGAALVAGSHAIAQLGKYEAFGQGLYGGSAQLGVGLGLFVTPQFLKLFNWRETLFVWSLISIAIYLAWLWFPDEQHTRGERIQTRQSNFLPGIRSSAIWTLGLCNMGTFGLSNAISAWLTIYFTNRYGLSIGLSALFGSLALFAGVLFRPLGGILIARWRRPLLLIRIGTIMTCCGIALMVLPFSSPILTGLGLLLFSLGTTLPYAAIFSTAAMVGARSAVGVGVAQGLAAVLASPASIIGPPLIGLLLESTGSITTAFGFTDFIFGTTGVVASLLLGLTIKRVLSAPALPQMQAKHAR